MSKLKPTLKSSRTLIRLSNSLVLSGFLIVSGCAGTGTVDVYSAGVATGDRVVIVSGQRTGWVKEIERQLKRQGFQIKRFASQNRITEQTSPTKSTSFNQAAARYELRLSATIADKCIQGGWRFASIDAELIDLRTNETAMDYTGSGYSERCAPLSGTLFGEIATGVAAVWK